jgi:hypothetical protein
MKKKLAQAIKFLKRKDIKDINIQTIRCVSGDVDILTVTTEFLKERKTKNE